MIWPFRCRKPVVPVHVGPTSVDWQPGDMAECIDGGPWYKGNRVISGPEVGDRAMVAQVFVGSPPAGDGSVTTFALRFLGMAAGRGWPAVNFRKIVLTDTGADRTVGKRAQ